MLELIDETLESLFRATVPLSAQDVDVSFDPPEEEWSAKLNRPTVNLYLWEARRSTVRARTGTELVEREGQLTRRMALPRIELQYLVTVWTANKGDERSLLGGLLRSALSFAEIPSMYTAEGLQGLPPLVMGLARAEQRDLFTLQERFKTGLNLMVAAVVETQVGTPAGPPAEEFGVRLRDRDLTTFDTPPRRIAGEVADPTAIGCAVTTVRGRGTVNASGRFLVPGAPGDDVILHTDPLRTAVVPDDGGVVFE